MFRVARRLFSHAGGLSKAAQPKLTLSNMNPRVVSAQYAVRGKIVSRASELMAQIAKAPTSHGLPFEHVLACNVGNPQALEQKPLTWYRQVLALCQYPAMADEPGCSKLLPRDAVERAQRYLDGTVGGMGSYTDSQGLEPVRDDVAQFIEQRDGPDAVPVNPNHIVLTNGASGGISMMLDVIMSDPTHGILCPIPQYPLYSAAIELRGGRLCGYYLDEETGWSMQLSELKRALADARAAGTVVRALTVINPGNPTGQVLTYDNIVRIVQFCREEGLVIIADEVYQENIYGDVPFTSFYKVVCDLGLVDDVQLASFHSVSKGIIGECGQRGGYGHFTGFDPEVFAQLCKLSSINLCPNLSGQVMVGLMVNPPPVGSESYERHQRECDDIMASLKRRAVTVSEGLNAIDGIDCQPVAGAMYAFPSVTLSEGAVAAAAAVNQAPDFFYCMALLEETGICVVPGSGFVQKDGSWHFRTTILPPEHSISAMVQTIADFHAKFTAAHA